MFNSNISINSWSFVTNLNQTTLAFVPTTSLSTLNCWIWLDANDLKSEGSVTTWNDKSGKGYHCTQSTASQKPTVSFANLQNNRPTLRFNYTSTQYLVGPTTFACGTNSFALFVVVKFNTNQFFQGVFNKSLYGDAIGRILCYRTNTG